MDEQKAIWRLGELADRQGGRVARYQLLSMGFGRGRIDGWRQIGILRPVGARGVYAFGAKPASTVADLWTAVLYAGPGAGIGDQSGAHFRGLIRYPPSVVYVSTPRRCTSIPGIVVHDRRTFTREIVDGVPMTSIAETMADLAASGTPRMVRRGLAELDYLDLLDLEALEAACTPSRKGAPALRAAMAIHNPQLARTKSEAEELFVIGCEDRGITPLPLSNAFVCGIEVDIFWPDHGFIVEIDGDAAHRSKPRRREDRRKELTLRSQHLHVVRYDPVLVEHDADRIYGEVQRELEARANWSKEHPGLRWHL